MASGPALSGIERASAMGSADAFQDAVRPHLAVMRRVAGVVAVGLDPDDVVQEALIRAWRRRATFQPERGSVRAWLVAVTADQARRLRQRVPAIRRAEVGLPDQGIESSTGDIDPDLDLRHAVGQLPTRQRQAILLYYYADLTVDEVAVCMGCASGTVKSTLADARRRLADLLGGSDD